jgi:hypothetical protein
LMMALSTLVMDSKIARPAMVKTVEVTSIGDVIRSRFFLGRLVGVSFRVKQNQSAGCCGCNSRI